MLIYKTELTQTSYLPVPFLIPTKLFLKYSTDFVLFAA